MEGTKQRPRDSILPTWALFIAGMLLAAAIFEAVQEKAARREVATRPAVIQYAAGTLLVFDDFALLSADEAIYRLKFQEGFRLDRIRENDGKRMFVSGRRQKDSETKADIFQVRSISPGPLCPSPGGLPIK
jgi:hypothetical protein